MPPQWQDKQTNKARNLGFYSRAVFKQKEAQEKFHQIQKNSKVIDLGCATGSWSLYVKEIIGKDGQIVGIDKNLSNIKDISSLKNIKFLKKDIEIWEPEIEHQKQYTTILSDASPSTTGIHEQDTYISSIICLRILELCKILYTRNPSITTHLLMKCYQGYHFTNLLDTTKKLFKYTKSFKPTSSRNNSKEMYIYARGFIFNELDTNTSLVVPSNTSSTSSTSTPSTFSSSKTYDDDSIYFTNSIKSSRVSKSHTKSLFTTPRKILRYKRKDSERKKEFIFTNDLYTGDEIFTDELKAKYGTPDEMLRCSIQRYTASNIS